MYPCWSDMLLCLDLEGIREKIPDLFIFFEKSIEKYILLCYNKASKKVKEIFKMRIKHTETEVYAVYFRCGRSDSGFHYHHLYSSVSGYRLAVKKLKVKYLDLIKKQRISYPLEIQVIWSPCPFCSDEDKCLAYEEAYYG